MTTTGAVPADEKALRRRWRAWRVLRRTVAVVAWVVLINLTFTVPEAGPWLLGQRSDAGTLTIEQSFVTNSVLGVVAGLLVLLLVLWFWGRLATSVDYRYIDVLCLFVPIYNIFWSARIVWRLTYRVAPVPVRDWPSAAARQTQDIDRLAHRLNPWST